MRLIPKLPNGLVVKKTATITAADYNSIGDLATVIEIYITLPEAAFIGNGRNVFPITAGMPPRDYAQIAFHPSVAKRACSLATLGESEPGDLYRYSILRRSARIAP